MSIGEIARILSRKRKRITLNNLKRVLPDVTLNERRRIHKKMFRHFGLMLQDTILMQKLARSPEWNSVLEIPRLDLLHELYSEEKGVILVTGHLGNWEIGGVELARRFKVNSVSRLYRNPFIQKEIEQFRAALGQKIIYIKNGFGPMVNALKQGEMLAILPDKHLNSNQIPVQFFGMRVKAPSGPAILSLKTGAPILPIAIVRIDEGFHFRLECKEPIRPDRGADFRSELKRITQAYMGDLENFIRETPEQWIWFHKRWKKIVEPGESEIEAYHPACTKWAWKKP